MDVRRIPDIRNMPHEESHQTKGLLGVLGDRGMGGWGVRFRRETEDSPPLFSLSQITSKHPLSIPIQIRRARDQP